MLDEGDRPVNRSPWWRTGAGMIAWLAFAIAATVAAWGAVAVVGGQGELSPVALPTGRTGSGEATTDSSLKSEASKLEGPQAGQHQKSDAIDTLSSPGGQVLVRCSSATTVVRVATYPNPGWGMIEERTGPDEVEVQFVGEDDEWRIRARCRDGVIDGEVDD